MPVACQLVNRSTWAKARGVLDEIRRAWPSPVDLGRADPHSVVAIVTPFGLQQGAGVEPRAVSARVGRHGCSG